MNIRRGDIYYADLSPVVGSEQGGLRPVLIVQNDVGNRYSPTVIAAAITSRTSKNPLPTHIDVMSNVTGLTKDSVVLLEQIRTIDKSRLKERMGHLDDGAMAAVNSAISISFGLGGGVKRHRRIGARFPDEESNGENAPGKFPGAFFVFFEKVDFFTNLRYNLLR